jgi:hypothetical protein
MSDRIDPEVLKEMLADIADRARDYPPFVITATCREALGRIDHLERVEAERGDLLCLLGDVEDYYGSLVRGHPKRCDCEYDCGRLVLLCEWHGHLHMLERIQATIKAVDKEGDHE